MVSAQIQFDLFNWKQPKGRLQCRCEHRVLEAALSGFTQERDDVECPVVFAVLSPGALGFSFLQMIETGLDEHGSATTLQHSCQLDHGYPQIWNVVKHVHAEHAVERGLAKGEPLRKRLCHSNRAFDSGLVECHAPSGVPEGKRVRVECDHIVAKTRECL